jgi:hypothetical protein
MAGRARQCHPERDILRHAIGDEIDEPGLAHGPERIAHQHQGQAGDAVQHLEFDKDAGAVGPPGVVQGGQLPPGAMKAATDIEAGFIDGAAAAGAMLAEDPGRLLDLGLVDILDLAAQHAFAAFASGHQGDLVVHGRTMLGKPVSGNRLLSSDSFLKNRFCATLQDQRNHPWPPPP